MKKIFIFLITIIVLFITLLIVRNKEELLEVYGMNEYIGLVDDGTNRLSLNIYLNKSKSLITYPSKNSYQLNMDNMNVLLEDVIVKEKAVDDYYEINISAKMPVIITDELYSNYNYLIIKNNEYQIKVNIGSLSILKPDNFPKLIIESITGSYSYINNNASLVGINMKTVNSYSNISYFRLGYSSYCNLNLIMKNTSFDNQINIKNLIPEYEYLLSSNYNQAIELDNNVNFYPISHNSFKLIRRSYGIITFDGITYYIEDNNFCNLPFNELKPYLIKGEVIWLA